MTLKISTLLTIALAFVMPIASATSNLIPMILNGYFAEKGAFPYFARIEIIHSDNHKTKCGASIISEYWLITSFDCVKEKHEKINAYFGIVADNDYESSAIIAKYSFFGAEGSELALLEMSDPIQYSDNVQPINLPNIFMIREFLMNKEVAIAGMGYYQKNESSKFLRYANIRVLSFLELIEHQKCSKEWMEKEICLVSDYGLMLAYIGDSGDPVTIEINNKKYLVGVVNARLGGTYNTAIAIYSYIAWITRVTGINYHKFGFNNNTMN